MLVLPEEQFDVRMVFHEDEGAPVSQCQVEGGEGLSTLYVIEATARVGDMKILRKRHVVFQHQPNPMCVHPLLPLITNDANCEI